ncbi:hypothetical protein [Sorangium sp. So ce233]|uniref:hypothetical protein n=1 Tax=Sorangium sp. So ce233 TaxID=3133290 RepID=UPI003F63454D
MTDPTTPTERRELRERAEAAHGEGLCTGLLHVDPRRLLALLEEHEALLVEKELRESAAADPGLTEEDLATFAALRKESRLPPDTGHVAECACGDCDRQVEASKYATKVFLDLRRLDAVGRLLGEVAALRAEQAADRAAVRALVEALPKCRACGRIGARRPSTVGLGGHVASDLTGNEDGACDEHADRHNDPGFAQDEDLPWAAPLRALQVRMATWGEAAEQAEEPEQDFLAVMKEIRSDLASSGVKIDAEAWLRELDGDDEPTGQPAAEDAPPTPHEPSSPPVPASDAGRRAFDRLRAVSAVWAEAEVPAVPPEPDGDEESAYDVGARR